MNGYDLVNLAMAQARLVAYAEAELAATIRELAYAAPGDRASQPKRVDNVDELAADELRGGSPPHPGVGDKDAVRCLGAGRPASQSVGGIA